MRKELIDILFLILLIISIIVSLKLDGRKRPIASSIMTLVYILLIVINVVTIGMGTRPYNDAKNKQISLANKWQLSNKTEQEWNWITEHMEETNAAVDECHNNHIENMILDSTYFIKYIFGKINHNDYKVIISENEIIFPEQYSILPIRYNPEK